MKLLNTKTFEIQPFISSAVPDYVIVSHRWSRAEVTYQDFALDPISNPNSEVRKLFGFAKVQGACNQAKMDGYDWIWIDSCCIDRSSSSELQEAINSMWNYYARSNICYVYIEDVLNGDDPAQAHQFNQSEWFSRGWTLQELIAPKSVEFYANDWSFICTKAQRYAEIASITNIDPHILVHEISVEASSAAEKLSWAAHRKVTREEDVAYSLLGLFQINMPMLYGEGKERAFTRLQEAAYNTSHDHTLFLFRYSLHQIDLPLLADSPVRFCPRKDCSSCSTCPTQLLPPATAYSEIVANSLWEVAPHQQILTTITEYRNEVSANLELLKYKDVSSELKFLDRRPTREISHVVVLNCTVNVYGDMSALCLLVFQPSNADGDAFRRISSSPVVLRHLENFTTKLQRRKILVCPTPIIAHRDVSTNVIFFLRSAFSQSWRAKYVSGERMTYFPAQNTREYSIKTSKLENEKHPATVSNLVTIPGNSDLKVLLQLRQFEETWSIKEVSEIRSGKRSGKSGTYCPKTKFSDRCCISLSDGKSFSVGLRRLSGRSRLEDNGPIASFTQLRYEVTLRYW